MNKLLNLIIQIVLFQDKILIQYQLKIYKIKYIIKKSINILKKYVLMINNKINK